MSQCGHPKSDAEGRAESSVISSCINALAMSKHWTDSMFIDHGDIFVRFLEAALPRTEAQTAGICRIFSDASVSEGSKVLDLSCGIGRHSVALAQRGFDVTGIDISPANIRRAEQRAKENAVESKTRFIVGDIRRLLEHLPAAKNRFDAFISMFTSIGYWDEETDRSILSQALELTTKGGLLILDVSNRDWLVRNFRPFDMTTLPGDPEYVMTEERKLVLETSRMNNIWTFYTREGKDLKHAATINLDHRVHSLHELIALVKSAAWEPIKSYGNFELDPVSLESHRLILACKRP